jgi:hypothetical protein
MKTSLTDLNSYLFEQLDRISNEDLTPEELEKEIKRSEAITDIAQTVIENANTRIKAVSIALNNGLATISESDIKGFIGIKNE